MSVGATFEGVVRGGVVVPDAPAALPEGTRVTVTVAPIPLPPDLQAEFDDWDRLSEEAWDHIRRLEDGEP